MVNHSSLLASLNERSVRYVVIGVWAANYYAPSGGAVFRTEDQDLFLPPDPANLLTAWEACESLGLELLSGVADPLDRPRDAWLSERVVERRALTRVTDGGTLHVDLTLVMAGFDFETVWRARRVFRVEGVEVPVALLEHIVASKALTGRDKDRLFLATHAEALRELLEKPRPLDGG